MKKDSLLLLLWLLGIGILCCILTWVFWYRWGSVQKEKDILGAFGCFVTIVGMGIAIYQVSKLRNEQQIIQSTEVLTKILKIKSNLTTIQNNIIHQTIFSAEIITFQISQCNAILNEIIEIKAKYNKVIDCNDCMDMLADLIGKFELEIDDKTFDKFKKRTYTQDLRKLIVTLNDLEVRIKT